MSVVVDAGAPPVTAATADLWVELPEHYRSQDRPLGFPLLRYLALVGDQVQDITDLLTLLQDGALGDPVNAPAEWLDFMAQFVALDATGLTVPEKRVAIDSASALLAGSLTSLARTVESLLGGQKRYLIELHSGGDPWAITVFANVDDAGGSTWDTLALQWASWNAWESAGTWDNLATVAPFSAEGVLNGVKPAWIVLAVETLGSGSIWLFLEHAVTSWDQWEAQFPTWSSLENGVFAWP